MIQRFDRLLIDVPQAKHPDPDSASALQELMGGKFGEMSTLMNYTFQSFNMRGRTRLRPFYDLIANIATEEYGHIELIAYTINSLLTGTTSRSTNPKSSPLNDALGKGNPYHYLAGGLNALPMDSNGQWWNGSYVFSSGNLKSDLLHNFFLEVGARGGKSRVYEMVKDPVAKRTVSYLLVRGGVHIVAYARALEKLTGANVGKLLPIPDTSNDQFPECKEFMDKGLHRILYKASPTDYSRAAEIFTGPHPETGEPLEGVSAAMPEGVPAPDYHEEPQINAPGMDEIKEMADWLSKQK